MSVAKNRKRNEEWAISCVPTGETDPWFVTARGTLSPRPDRAAGFASEAEAAADMAEMLDTPWWPKHAGDWRVVELLAARQARTQAWAREPRSPEEIEATYAEMEKRRGSERVGRSGVRSQRPIKGGPLDGLTLYGVVQALASADPAFSASHAVALCERLASSGSLQGEAPSRGSLSSQVTYGRNASGKYRSQHSPSKLTPAQMEEAARMSGVKP